MTTPPPPVAPPPPPVMPAPEGPQQRPVTVTAAAGLMMVIGVITLISAVLGLVVIDDAKEKFAENARAIGATEVTIQQISNGITVGIVVGIVYSLVVVVAFSVLALLNLRGNNVGRIVTWVVSGLFLLCNVCSLAGQGLSTALTSSGNGAALDQAAANVYPGWYTTASIAIAIAQALCFIAIIVLLALPQSHPFFRKQPPTFVPPQA